MIRVTVEMREGATLLRATVQAESISRAMSIAQGCHPGRDVRLAFPIDPERFFVEEPEAETGPIEYEAQETLAG